MSNLMKVLYNNYCENCEDTREMESVEDKLIKTLGDKVFNEVESLLSSYAECFQKRAYEHGFNDAKTLLMK